ncbi:hypothetical protein Efla_000512 [Eimeria flavescens]
MSVSLGHMDQGLPSMIMAYIGDVHTPASGDRRQLLSRRLLAILIGPPYVPRYERASGLGALMRGDRLSWGDEGTRAGGLVGTLESLPLERSTYPYRGQIQCPSFRAHPLFLEPPKTLHAVQLALRTPENPHGSRQRTRVIRVRDLLRPSAVPGLQLRGLCAVRIIQRGRWKTSVQAPDRRPRRGFPTN